MINAVVTIAGILGGIASFLAIWVKDPLLPEKLRERARRRERLSTLDAVAAEVLTIVSETAAKSARNARDRLRLGWKPVGRSMQRDHLEALANEAKSWPQTFTGDPRRWINDPAQLGIESAAASGRRPRTLCDVLLHGIPTRRLLIVGDAGAGKSFLLNLIAYHWPRSARGATTALPVPVVLSLTSWDPHEHGLMEWVTVALENVHPFLGAPCDEGHSWATELVWRQRVLPLLDGLDEIPHDLQKRAVDHIVNELDDGVGVVITCRDKEATRLKAEWDTAVVLEPAPLLEADEQAFLSGSRRKGEGEDRWGPVIDVLNGRCGTKAEREALSKPLMLDLARTIYNPRPGCPSRFTTSRRT